MADEGGSSGGKVVARCKRGGVPVAFVALVAGLAIIIQATADLGQITAFSSLAFLAVFVVVNASALPHRVFTRWGRLRLAFIIARRLKG